MERQDFIDLYDVTDKLTLAQLELILKMCQGGCVKLSGLDLNLRQHSVLGCWIAAPERQHILCKRILGKLIEKRKLL